MGYLICKNCEVYYEADDSSNNLSTCEKCGGNLKYYDSFDDYYNETEYSNEVEHLGRTYGIKEDSGVFADYITQEQLIAVLIDEFKPTKNENLMIIFTFVLSVLVFLVSFISHTGIEIVLTLVLFFSGILMIFFKLFRRFGLLWPFWWIMRPFK